MSREKGKSHKAHEYDLCEDDNCDGLFVLGDWMGRYLHENTLGRGVLGPPSTC